MKWHVLADTFSWNGWRHEGATRVYPPKGIHNALKWRSLLRNPPKDTIDFLLVESAWEGFRRRFDCLSIPLELIKAYQRARIPVVFWNKEDPVSFYKFLNIALECDAIFTTDEDCISKYQACGFDGPVSVMTFAAQPIIHRQYKAKTPENRLFFAGTLRDRYPTRKEGYQNIIVPALKFGLDIFSRKGNWPKECHSALRGSLPYEKLIVEYSSYEIGLNISSVKDSPTMFPRRVVEMTMANCLVISDNCLAVRNLFPEIPRSSSRSTTMELLEHYLNAPDAQQQVIDATKQRIEADFTYARQLQRIRDVIPL